MQKTLFYVLNRGFAPSRAAYPTLAGRQGLNYQALPGQGEEPLNRTVVKASQE